MQKIRLVSDIHLDFDIHNYRTTRLFDPSNPDHVEQHRRLQVEGDMGMLWFPKPHPDDLETTLILAGDLWVDRRFLTRKFTDGESWMQKLSKLFKHVVFVLGNHDYWHLHLDTEKQKCIDEMKLQGLQNVHYLENESVVIGDVKFVGGTLWTDFNKRDPMILQLAEGMMNDYVKTKAGPAYGKMRAHHVLKHFVETKKYIFANAHKDNPEQHVVVVTHMAPCEMSIHPDFKQYTHQMQANYLYFTELSQEIMDQLPDVELWVHGHTHKPCDYMIGNCRVSCNPRGYAGAENTGYDPLWSTVIGS